MVEVGDLRKGMHIVVEGEIYRVIDVNKHFTARGSGMVRTKLKNVTTGYIREMTFNSGEKVQPADLSLRKAQYLYNDGDNFYFMTLDDYETRILDEEKVGDAKWYLVENMEVDLQFFEDEPIGILLPTTVVLEVRETEPGFKGDTVSGGSKPAILETGLKINVPLFIEVGEKVKVDTRSGEYVGRA